MPCSVCNHPDLQAINQALLDGATLAAVSKQFNLSTSALDLHKAHLRARVQRDRDRVERNLQQYGAFWLSRTLDMVERVAKAAEAEGNFRLVLQAVRLGLSLLNTINKQDCQFDDWMVYAILTSPQWADQTSLLPDDPNIMASVRQALTGVFTDPCPDSEAQPVASAPAIELNHDPVKAALSDKTERNHAKKVNGNRQTAKGLFKWEKTGKLPGKTCPKQVNAKNNQEDALWEKISGLHRHCLTGPPAATPDGKLANLFRQCDKEAKIPTDIPLSEYLHERSLQAEQAAA